MYDKDLEKAKEVLIKAINIEPWGESLCQNLPYIAGERKDKELFSTVLTNLRTELPDSQLLIDIEVGNV